MSMSVIRIKNVKDPRIQLYRNVRDKTLAARHHLFVAEGEFLVQRLFASSFKIESVFISEKRLSRFADHLPEECVVYSASDNVLSAILGFHFHRGVLALAHRKPLESSERFLMHPALSRLLILPEINNTENLGLVLRSACGLGFQHVLLGSSCCDPFSRRALRTGMGASLRLHLGVFNKMSVFEQIRNRGISIHAAALSENSVLLDTVQPPSAVALLIGPEAYGLSDAFIQQSDCVVKIPMHNATDSLNVAVAAGILMYHYAQS